MPVGLVVNPVAGVGGPAGLKGSDGAHVQAQALSLGAERRSIWRAASALRILAGRRSGRVLVPAGDLGETAARAAGAAVEVLDTPALSGRQEPSGLDSTEAARALVAAGADLILFAGGDGTARDVAAGAGDVAILGIPAGVKMYSSCFAVAPAMAGAIAREWLEDGPLATVNADVLDVDEHDLRLAPRAPTLFATVRIPATQNRTQARKAASSASDARSAALEAARGFVASMQPGVRYLLGPGSTMVAVADVLGVEATPLGFDVVLDGALIARDADERALFEQVSLGPARAVVTIIGGQGFVLGRGNQQLSPRVLRAMGERPIIVVADQQKLIDLRGRPLMIDSGDATLDAELAGHIAVCTGRGTTSFYPVSAPEREGGRSCD